MDGGWTSGGFGTPYGVETMWTSSVQLGVAAVGYKQSVGWGVSCERGVVGGVVGNNLMFYLVV